jgi:hypothetical protein
MYACMRSLRQVETEEGRTQINPKLGAGAAPAGRGWPAQAPHSEGGGKKRE